MAWTANVSTMPKQFLQNSEFNKYYNAEMVISIAYV